MLINSEKIYAKANELTRQCGTRDTLEIAQMLGVDVSFSDSFNSLLGMYVCDWKHRFIVLNGNLDPYMLQMVCGHEVGHDTFHRDLAKKGMLQEFVLFNMRNTTEYEANAFAAHVLIDDDELRQYLLDGYDVVQIASMLNTHINLLLVKLAEMNRLGCHWKLPYMPSADFLRKVNPSNE
jgi:Zn-dependent peptidase ImmA (M78 family)